MKKNDFNKFSSATEDTELHGKFFGRVFSRALSFSRCLAQGAVGRFCQAGAWRPQSRAGALRTLCLSALFSGSLFAQGFKVNEQNKEKTSYVTSEVLPYVFRTPEEDPGRTPPFFGIAEEWLGDRFLGNGELAPGFEIPTGAVWQPRLWLYGTYRSSLGYFDNGNGDQAEWANRLSLFANLQLTGTERILFGFEPFHRDGEFLGYSHDGDEWESNDPSNFRLRTLFFEGDLAEIFPGFDPNDSKALDIGFSIGRQNLVFQDGFLINDVVDAVGLTKNNLRFEGLPWLSNLRLTALYGWNEINRNNDNDDNEDQLFAFLTQADTNWGTMEADVIYVDSGDQGDILVWGLSNTTRLAQTYNWTVRALGSWATEDTSEFATNGQVFFNEFSLTPKWSEDLVYWSTFYARDNFSSAARDENVGGPLGRTGLLFAARGIGNYPSPLNNGTNDAYGSSLGYQMFFDNNRRHLIFEVGGVKSIAEDSEEFGGAFQVQQAFGNRYILQFDTFATKSPSGDENFGLRTEFLVKF